MKKSDAGEIRRRAFKALERNRVPGYHFAGLFLGLESRRFEKRGVAFSLAAGPHCTDASGRVNPAVVSYVADMVLAAAVRAYVKPVTRTATLLLRLDYTGAPALGSLTAEGRSDGFSPHTALPQAAATGSLLAGGVEVVRMSGLWVAPPTPPGRTLSALPWETRKPIHYPKLSPSDLDAQEIAVMRLIERASRIAGPEGLLPHLWSPTVRRTAGGATSRVPLGLHFGNRVGHVQGGLTMHVALETAVAAVPHHPLLTSASAWYISPGQGRALTTRSTVLQTGRNVAVVRTEVFNAGRKLALEVISNHAVAAS